MQYERLPKEIEKDIERIARQQHISANEALVKVVEKGLASFQTKPGKTLSRMQLDTVAEAIRKAEVVRASREQELSEQVSHNQAAFSLIGFLKEEPEIIEAIRQAGLEQRKALYD